MRENRRPRVILGILLLVAFSLVAIDLRADANGPLGGVKRATGSVVGPAVSAVSAVTAPVRSFLGGLTSAGERDAQMAVLEAEVARLRAAGASADTTRRLGELNDLLRMSQAGQYRMVPAQVIAAGPSQGFARTVTLDVGTRDGVTADMTVLARGGLAGRVAVASTTSCIVVLLVDPTVSVGGRLEGQGEIGFVSGVGSESELEFQLLDPYGSLKAGDRVVTFGSKSGKPYVPGVPIGEVVEVSGTPGQLTRLARVRPYVNVSTLDVVAVVTEPPRQDPRDTVLLPPLPALLPSEVPLIPTPEPTPSPTATATEPSASPEPSNDAASPASEP